MGSSTWAKVKKFPGYEVSTGGLVRSYWVRHGRTSKIEPKSEPRAMNPNKDDQGRLFVTLYNREHGTKNAPVARLVLEAHKGAPKKGQVVGYKDGDYGNCKASNLFWTTRKEVAAAMKARGVAVGAAAGITDKKAERMRKLAHDKGLTKAEIARKFKVSKATAGDVLNGKSHVATAA